MSTTPNAELKLLKLSDKIRNDIDTAKSQILYQIKDGARITRELLQGTRKPNEEEEVLLPAETYNKILDYLLCIERDTMYNYNQNGYLKTYYEQIEINEKLLTYL